MNTKLPDLYEYFNQFGKLNKIIIPYDKNNKNEGFKGYSLVTFEDRESVEKVNAKEKHFINDREVYISIAKTKKEARDQMETKNNKTLYIGRISQDTTKEDLEDYFKQFGKLESAYLIYEKDTNISKRFGFVEYEKEEIAKNVIDMKFHFLNGKNIAVRYKWKKLKLNYKISKKSQKFLMENQYEDACDTYNPIFNPYGYQYLPQMQSYYQNYERQDYSYDNGLYSDYYYYNQNQEYNNDYYSFDQKQNYVHDYYNQYNNPEQLYFEPQPKMQIYDQGQYQDHYLKDDNYWLQCNQSEYSNNLNLEYEEFGSGFYN